MGAEACEPRGAVAHRAVRAAFAAWDLPTRAVDLPRDPTGGQLNTTALLRAVLPTEIAGAVDWSTLVRDSATYVQDSLRQLHGDLLSIAELRDGDLRIAFPLEHQSALDHQHPGASGHLVMREAELVLDVA